MSSRRVPVQGWTNEERAPVAAERELAAEEQEQAAEEREQAGERSRWRLPCV